MQSNRDHADFTADFLQLLTRIFATVMLGVIALVYLTRREYIPMILFGVISLLVQRSVVKLFRRLRDERAAIVTARNAVIHSDTPDATAVSDETRTTDAV